MRDDYEKAWKAIAASEHGKAIAEGLRGVYDMPLMESTPEMTGYRVGQRDLARELLHLMGVLNG